eukprot:726605-Pyramimonas_sp.AAC.1
MSFALGSAHFARREHVNQWKKFLTLRVSPTAHHASRVICHVPLPRASLLLPDRCRAAADQKSIPYRLGRASL